MDNHRRGLMGLCCTLDLTLLPFRLINELSLTRRLVTWAIVAISFWFYPDEEAPTAKFFAEHCRVVVHSFLTPPEGDGGNATEVFNHTSSGVGALAARAYTWL